MYPPAGAVTRQALEDDEYNGIKIPKGAWVTPLIRALHYNEAVWGADVKTFNPDRFGTLPSEVIRDNSMAFSLGPRNCIGQLFALLEIKSVMATLVRDLDMRADPDHLVEQTETLTLQPKNDIHIAFTKRVR